MLTGPSIGHIAICGAFIAFLAICCTVSSIVDLRDRRLPNGVSLLILGGGIAFASQLDGDIVGAVSAAAIAWLSLHLVARIYRRWRGVAGLGAGDAKFLGACAPWIGVTGLAPALVIASLSALAATAIAAAAGYRIDRRSQIPFGPFLSLGVVAIALARVAGFDLFVGGTP